MSTTSQRSALRSKDLTTLADLSPEEFAMVLRTAAAVKAEPSAYATAMAGRSAVLLFEKDSLRTRCSFEVGVHRLGGHAMHLDHSRQRIGERESIADYARNLERWFAVIVARVYRHATVEGLARHASVPVVNALCDLHHPCQALADFHTLTERLPSLGGDLRRLRLAYIGEGNNVSHSLLHAAALAGATLTLVAPPGCGPCPDIVRESELMALRTGARLRVSHDPDDVRDHHAVYTDTWFSMGSSPASSTGAVGAAAGGPSQETPEEAEARRQAKLRLFAPYQVNLRLLDLAGPEALFMHCLPACRGVEVTDEVIDSPRSIVYDQAENRLHAQNALLLHLLGAE